MRVALLALTVLIGGCAGRWPAADTPAPDPVRDRALLLALLPAQLAAREDWAADIYAAFSALQLPATAMNYCAVIAVTEQESGFKADPVVPGLSRLARKEIESRAAALHIPNLVLRAALSVSSSDGRSFSERIDQAKTERELSEIYEDMIAIVPLGSRLLAGRNPVRTGGPMQVSIAYAEALADERTYPYPLEANIRREVFTRRGGMYFGIAHLLAYPAAYDQPLYRFADFNAGHYASRNAAFQQALSLVSGIPLKLDGDLIRRGSSRNDPPGQTELAARILGERVGLGPAAIRRDLEQGHAEHLSETALYREVFALAHQAKGASVPRAALPDIRLHSPKITRKLTTAWFANRVQERYERCLKRSP